MCIRDSYRLILNLSEISKKQKQYEQRVVKSRLTEYLSTNNLLNLILLTITSYRVVFPRGLE